MIPQFITVLDTMPVNENGKIDRKALARARPTRAAISRDVRAPVSEAERQMQMLWAQLLHMKPESIGLDDNSFQMGGDPISAMKLVVFARKHSFQISLNEMFQYLMLATMACRLKYLN